MDSTIIFLDNGHGVDTPGKRSPVWEGGRQLLEWEFNRAIVQRILHWSDRWGFRCLNLVPEDADVSLKERCRRANEAAKELDPGERAVFISIHANAAPVPQARGVEVFTSPGESEADETASIMIQAIEDSIPGVRMRTDFGDGDADKEERFAVLMGTHMPALLIECGFMTNYEECQKLMSEEGRDEIAQAIVTGIVRIVERSA